MISDIPKPNPKKIWIQFILYMSSLFECKTFQGSAHDQMDIPQNNL